jgi:orotidine 5'-phosphate decarboxylase subfamily 1
MDATGKIWIGLDCPKTRALEVAEAIGDHPAVRGFKLNRLIDAENFRSVCEAGLFEALTKHGKALWADMKIHDIPETAKGRTEAYVNSRYFQYLTVMAKGGVEMMKAAVEAASDKLNVIAVTELTSLSPETVLDLSGREVNASVCHLAGLAVDAGVKYLVCSGKELQALNADPKLASLLKFVPAISPAWTLGDQADQKRTSTPKFVLENDPNATMVIARAIVKADDPLEAVKKTAAEIEAIAQSGM